ncbi:MAG: CaiB/BaiF CoA-transferase family protein [Acidimicrobiales bacterium]|jgi:crotonobetainyl-CoA:carnitine CoA-transferase CaiB-like acyl-CoA transferase|nr:CaiB/BaiF CoA-transferase family protein [Acidimicrobiales bacterium]
MTKPLDGLLVVAVEQAVAAPLATVRLADAGARVLKIERHDGDFARGYDTAAGGDSSYFGWLNHGKESVALDIKAPADAALLHQLIGAADVFIQNLAPGALDRAGFGSTDLRAAHTDLITCDISGYGEDPALADKKAYDLLVQAESGMVAVSGGPTELGRIGVSICDIGAGVTAHAAILEALIRRSLTGEGSGVQVSLFDVAAEWMAVPFAQHLADSSPQRAGLRHPTIAPYGAYETSDGLLTLISVQNEREWVRLCAEALDRADLVADERFASNTERVANRPALERELAATIATKSRAEFEAALGAASLAFGSVNSLDDLVDHRALRQRPLTSSTDAAFSLPAHPVRGGSATDEPRKVPRLGEQTEAIRAEFS